MLLACIIKPLFFLTIWMLMRGQGVPPLASMLKYPAMMDLLNPAHSPVMLVLQYYSGMLLLWCGPLMFIHLFLGYKSQEELFEDKPRLLQIRGCVLAASGWTYYRHWHRGDQWPWKAVGIADDRLPMDTRSSLASMLLAGRSCCLGRVAQIFSETVQNANQMFQGLFMNRMLAFARIILIQNAAVENAHARNKQHNPSSRTTWATMAARYTAAESKLIQQNAISMVGEQKGRKWLHRISLCMSS